MSMNVRLFFSLFVYRLIKNIKDLMNYKCIDLLINKGYNSIVKNSAEEWKLNPGYGLKYGLIANQGNRVFNLVFVTLCLEGDGNFNKVNNKSIGYVSNLILNTILFYFYIIFEFQKNSAL